MRPIRVFSTAIVVAVVSGSLWVPTAQAQDAASLEAAVRDYYEKLNGEDASAAEYIGPEGDLFPRTGLLLTPLAGEPADQQENFDAGLDFDVELRHLSARVFGDMGIATYYTTGPTTYADGVVVSGTFRATAVAVRQDNQWRIVHFHLSKLQTMPE